MADTQEKKVCPCCTKHTMRSEEERKKLINRLKRVEGQIRGIIGMLENDAYCNDILIQSAAVNAAVNAFNKELLASHIEFEVDDNKKVHNVRFIGGCSGNTQGVASLVEGMDANEVISRLKGIKCGFKNTSCPDQLSIALEEVLNK